MTQAIHYVDMLQYIMGPVAEVSAYTATRDHARIVVEDVAVAAVKFRSGAVGLIEGSTLAYPGYYARLDIYGSGGSVVIEDDNIKSWHLRSGEPHQAEDEAIPSIAGSSSLNIWEISHRKQIEDVVDAVRKDRPPEVSGEDGRQALEIILAVYESARLGNPVRLADV
jgi:predicted dehydrogenase